MSTYKASPLPDQDMHSPWTDAFQSSPVHQGGTYHERAHEQDEQQAPTHDAIEMFYEDDRR
jgi:hypothetical protein